MDQREQQLQSWLAQHFAHAVKLTLIVGDASFRRYFRFTHNGQSLIAMDSPPQLEDCRPFIDIAHALRTIDLNTPHIIHADAEQGFLVITDFGDDLYHHILDKDNADPLYQRAVEDLHKIQTCQQLAGVDLACFDATFMRNELDLFTTWLVEKYLKIPLDTETTTLLSNTYQCLIDSAVRQPQVIIHRDYHSRNLMHLPNDVLGIIDFQDAMIGPITYDLVSMIRDCYLDWPVKQVEAWAFDFYQRCITDARFNNVDWETFLQWFDLMGMQRHLKASFIFARKYLRDGNPFYLQFLPRTLNYIRYVSSKYSMFEDFNRFFNTTVLTRFEKTFAIGAPL